VVHPQLSHNGFARDDAMVGVGSHIPYQLLRYKNLKTTEKCLRSPQQQETAEKKPDLYDHIADNATHIIICDELSSG
jgi:hypothetical protein